MNENSNMIGVVRINPQDAGLDIRNGDEPLMSNTSFTSIPRAEHLLLELPLPVPLQYSGGLQSLLSHLEDPEEPRRLLNTPDSSLISCLVDVLNFATANHIEVMEENTGGQSCNSRMSQLAQHLLERCPGLLKNCVNGPQNIDVDNRSWSQILQQTQLNDTSDSPKEHQSTSSSVLPRHLLQNRDSSQTYFPLKYPVALQNAKTRKKKTLKESHISPSRSVCSYEGPLYPTSSSDHNNIREEVGDLLTDSFQESLESISSTIIRQCIVPIPKLSGCVNEDDPAFENLNKIDSGEYHNLNSAEQLIKNVAPNCSPVTKVLNDHSYASYSAASSTSLTTYTQSNMRSITDGLNSPDVDFVVEPVIEHRPSARINYANSQSEYAKEKVINTNISRNGSTVQHSNVPVSISNIENDTSKRESKGKSSTNDLKRKITFREPVVRLERLSSEDILLSQKDVDKFLVKTKERTKRVKQAVTNSNQNKTGSNSTLQEGNDESCGHQSPLVTISPCSEKSKKLKNKKSRKDLRNGDLSVSLMESSTYQHFSRVVDDILDSMEDVDFSAAYDTETDIDEEVLISLEHMQELYNGSAKLKRLQAMNLFPTERLVLLLSILDRNIIDGTDLSIEQTEEEQDEEAGLLAEETLHRVMRSANASLTALYIMTSQNMPQKIFAEDVIEKIVRFLKHHLLNSIFPVYDPAYRSDPKSKDGDVANAKQKRNHACKINDQSTNQLYNKLHEILNLLSELLELQSLPDTLVFQLSAIGVSPFFVEGIRELQLNALRLVTNIFARYDGHRDNILDDILSSIARLPTRKRNIRNYHLSSGESIQMLTALVLQMTHSMIRLPESETGLQSGETPENLNTTGNRYSDSLIRTSYEASIKMVLHFLSKFFKKCKKESHDTDYRPLFNNFVQDLLSIVKKPEWPASGLTLSVLGRLLVRVFSDQSMDVNLRILSLDYLGILAAWLRKESAAHQERKNIIKEIVERIISYEESNASPSRSENNSLELVKQYEIQILQKAVLKYFDSNEENDRTVQYFRKFYIAEWYIDVATEIYLLENSLNSLREETRRPKTSVSSKSEFHLSASSSKSSQVTCEEQEFDEEISEVSESDRSQVEVNSLELAEGRKRFLLTVIKKQESSKVNVEENRIDYKTAELVIQYLSSTRGASKGFSIYLKEILRALSETNITIRNKAMKSLTLVIEADPSILAYSNMQNSVHGRLLDHAICVRESAVDLLGKFILIRPELISQYYDMLIARILDTGVSVRRRVIKILKDICLQQPDFPKIPEICVQLIKRVEDEDGIKKLVEQVFKNMWFTPVSDKDQERAFHKVKNIINVVDACGDTELEWFEQLITNLLKNEESSNDKSVVDSCKQIIDCLVEHLLQLEESTQNVPGGASSQLVSCLATLHLFSKTHPPFVVPHVSTLQPYLSMKCNTSSDFLALKNVLKTLAVVVPLMEHPSELFLVRVEEDLVKLVLRQHIGLLPSCVSCLGAIVNKVTHNFELIRDCFRKVLFYLSECKREYEKDPSNEILKSVHPKLLRSLYTVGLFCCHFDCDIIDSELEHNSQTSLKGRVFENILFFNQHGDKHVRLKALTGLGFMVTRYYQFMLRPEVKTLYNSLLTSPEIYPVFKRQVLKNITDYLVAEEIRMIEKDAEWNKNSKSENLKEMHDVTSGMASTIIQVYLKQILECVLHADISVRKASLFAIHLVLGQGLVHPVQIVPYLACLGSDDDPVIQTKADQLLQQIDKRYSGFIQMKATLGVKMSYEMQKIIQNTNEILRGFRCPECPVSRNGFLYSVMRSTRQSRRAFLKSLVKLFDEEARTPLRQLLYIADNIVYFPYITQDEPLFVIYELDIKLSVSGSNLLHTFQENILERQPSGANKHIPSNTRNCADDDDTSDDDDNDREGESSVTDILVRLPEDTSVLQECIIASQGCVLLLYVKQALKQMYDLTDKKIQMYSPNETAKVYERPLNRKYDVKFNPETVLNLIKTGLFKGELDAKGKEDLVSEYLHFRQLMLTIDPSNDNEDGESNVDLCNQDKGRSSAVSSTLNSPENVTNSNSGERQTHLPVFFKKTRSATPRKRKSSSQSPLNRKLPKMPEKNAKTRSKKKRK